jgi:tRNA dimethylallyltransferase
VKTSKPIVVILGPTASGKTGLALEVAHRLRAEILSVDSMQVYRGMDIGTAKPAIEERRDIPHHLIDVAEPSESFAVARFVELADRVIVNCNVPLIATGGTPLYYKSLFEGLFDGPGADAEIRLRLGAEPLDALHSRLAQVDPTAAARIHVNDRKRLIRALEVFELTGQPISSFQTEWSGGAVRHEAIWFGLMWEREALNRRINTRVKSMIEQGWLEETRGLLTKYGQLSRTAAEATGYHELIEHLQGRISLDEAIEQIKIATRQLARRQMKWFRRFRDVNWLDGARQLDQLADEVMRSIA